MSPPVVRAVEWLGDHLRILDQTALPAKERWIDAHDVAAVSGAIRTLAVRGAPLLGVTAAYGVALAAARSKARAPEELLQELRAAASTLSGSRPTAVNLRWGAGRALSAGERAARRGGDAGAIRRAVEEEASRIASEDEEACRRIGELGAALVPKAARVLTHCNTGALATGGIGTAVGVILTARDAGKDIHVWVDETRPVLQGARLTAWELQRLRIPMTLIADSAAGALMGRGEVDLVVVGADRIAMNGDVANKVGTYALAVLASHHGVPFYVAAPVSTVDPETASGDQIVIERRDPDEVVAPLGVAIAPAGTAALNPAFDVTPAALISAIVTDCGVARPPYGVSLRGLLNPGAREVLPT